MTNIEKLSTKDVLFLIFLVVIFILLIFPIFALIFKYAIFIGELFGI